MAFDVNGARQAGYSDDEIAAFLLGPLGQQTTTPRPLPQPQVPGVQTLGPLAPPPGPPPRATQAPPALPQDQGFGQTLSNAQLFSLPQSRPMRNLYDLMLPEMPPMVASTPVSGMTQDPIATSLAAFENARDLANPSKSFGERAGAASRLARQGMDAGMPYLLPAVGRAPWRTLGSLGTMSVMGHGTEQGLTGLGVHPGTAALAGDIAGFGAGAAAHGLPWRNLSMLTDPEILRRAGPQIWRDESGEIRVTPSRNWTSSLRDLIEAKAPGKVNPQQLGSILKQASPEEVKWSLGDLGRTVEEMSKGGTWKPFEKGEVLGQIKQPEITEILRTDPDTKYGGWTLPGGEHITNELVLQLPYQSGRYESGHWSGITNPLAHVRFNERLTPAGEPVLFLEELQSDWHQRGRKEGYENPNAQFEKRQAEGRATNAYDAWQRAQQQFADRAGTWESNEESRQAFDQLERLRQEWEQANRHWGELETQSTRTKVPQAPFSKDWHELLMKRMIQEAVDKGYNKLAWTTGEQQNERYNLSKHIGKVEYSPDHEFLEAWDPSGNRVLDQDGVTPDRLHEYVGREVADKLLKQAEENPRDHRDNYTISTDEDGRTFVMHREKDAGERWYYDDFGRPFEDQADARGWVDSMVEQTNERHERPSVSGLDLRTGGEGMKGFYDKILPSFAGKYGKKFGAKVGQSEIQIPGEYDYSYQGPEYTPEQFMNWLQERRDRWRNGTAAGWNSWNVTVDRAADETLRSMLRDRKSFRDAIGEHASFELAKELGGSIEQQRQPKKVTVHSLEITPEMRRAVREGQPMFGTTMSPQKQYELPLEKK